MKLISPAFEHEGFIPEMFSYEDGDCINPELLLSGIPEKAMSLVLVMDDIDADNGSFFHWMVFDIPANTIRIEQDSIPGTQAVNSAKRKGYTGPRPPQGPPHRYAFRIYALDTVLGLPEGTHKDIVLKAMEGHIIDKAELIGSYGKKVQEAVAV